jgi:hypothetical protein
MAPFMDLLGCKKELQAFLEKPSKSLHVVVMPDFFLDRLINLQWDTLDFSNQVALVAQRKGGSIDGVPQMDMKGGNAVNVASALSALNVKVTPIICTSEYGLQQLKYYFRNNPLDFSHAKIRSQASITTALELATQEGKSNVMLRDVGSLADFGPNDLTEQDFNLILDCDYCCVFNWVGTFNFGTALAENVFSKVKTNGRAKTYFDTADPTPHQKGIPELLEKVITTSNLDI